MNNYADCNFKLVYCYGKTLSYDDMQIMWNISRVENVEYIPY